MIGLLGPSRARRIPTALVMALPCLFAMTASAIEIVAHRGASHDAPENTIAATRMAWDQLADVVETDIRLTRDGQIIVIHDDNAKRTTGRSGLIANMPFAETRLLDAGSWKGVRFSGEKLPTLEEQIATTPKGKRLFVEIKVGPEIVPELSRCLARASADKRKITVISFHADTLREVRRQMPELPVLYLVAFNRQDGKSRLVGSVSLAREAGFAGLHMQSTWPLDAADAKMIRDAGLELHVWTVDDVDVARRWIALGARSVTTNRPGWLREQLGRGQTLPE